MSQVPWVVHGTEVRDGRSSTERKLVKVQFAEKDGACLLQTHNDLRVFGWHTILEDATGSSGSDASSVDIVLQRDRNPVQWSAPFSALLLGFHIPRRCKR